MNTRKSGGQGLQPHPPDLETRPVKVHASGDGEIRTHDQGLMSPLLYH
jgi:hypothetical protein